MSPVRSSTLAPVIAGAVCLGLALAPAQAVAFEREVHLGARAGVATLSEAGTGPALGVHAAYGLSDMFDATFEALASRHGGSSGTDVYGATVGLTYKIDVFEWIPYLGVMGGYSNVAGAPGPNGEHGGGLGGAAQAGLDYLLTREIALGLELRWHALAHEGFHMPLFSTTLGAEYRFGW